MLLLFVMNFRANLTFFENFWVKKFEFVYFFVIGGFCADRISISSSGKNQFLFVKKSRQIQMRQILAS